MESKIEIIDEFYQVRKNGKRDRKVKYRCPVCKEEKISSPWNLKKTTCCKQCRNKQFGKEKLGQPNPSRGVSRPHAAREKSARWNGGRFINTQGYVMVLVKSGSIDRNSGWENYRPEHIVNIEQSIGRKLINDECVHHIDGDRQNNQLDNLVLISSNQEHRIIHSELSRLCYELCQQGIVDFDKKKLRYFIVNKNNKT